MYISTMDSIDRIWMNMGFSIIFPFSEFFSSFPYSIFSRMIMTIPQNRNSTQNLAHFSISLRLTSIRQRVHEPWYPPKMSSKLMPETIVIIGVVPPKNGQFHILFFRGRSTQVTLVPDNLVVPEVLRCMSPSLCFHAKLPAKLSSPLGLKLSVF